MAEKRRKNLKLNSPSHAMMSTSIEFDYDWRVEFFLLMLMGQQSFAEDNIYFDTLFLPIHFRVGKRNRWGRKKNRRLRKGRKEGFPPLMLPTPCIYIGLYMLQTIYKTFYPFSFTIGDGWGCLLKGNPLGLDRTGTWICSCIYIYIFLLLYSVPSGYKRPS